MPDIRRGHGQHPVEADSDSRDRVRSLPARLAYDLSELRQTDLDSEDAAPEPAAPRGNGTDRDSIPGR